MRLIKRSLSKRILSSNAVQSVACMIVAMYIRLVHFTGRWQVVRGQIPAAFWDQDRPFILAFWHGRILLMPYAWRPDEGCGRGIHMLISAHRDGQLIAKTVGHLGIRTIEGSSTRGGAAALKRMMGILTSGECVGITPDGPRGPRMRVSSGVIALARLSGAPVIPATYSVARWRILSSWDRFIIAWPFCRGVFVWGEPIEIPRDADERTQEDCRRTIEEAMNSICLEADRMTGLPTPEPDPVAAPGRSEAQQ